MRVGSRGSAEHASPLYVRQSSTGWRQAGFPSFAYRLAHLGLPWPITVMGMFVIFYLA